MKELSKEGIEIINLIQKKIYESKDQENIAFSKYKENILSGIKGYEYIYILDYINEKLNLKGKKILDIGSGYCIDSMIFSLYGADVISLDFDDKRYKESKSFLKSVGQKNLSFVKGSALELPVKNESIDIVFCNEFISHVSSLTTAIEDATRVLKWGGILFIADTNSQTLRGKIVHRSIYKKIENDLIKQNIEIVKKRCNEKGYKLNDNEILFLTKKTMGCLKSEILDVIDYYLENKKLKEIKIKFKYRNAENGYYKERYFTPKQIKKRLESHGFKDIYYIAPVNYRLRRFYKFFNNSIVNKIFQKLLFKKYFVWGYKKNI